MKARRAQCHRRKIAAQCYFGTNYREQVKLYRANLGINEWVILTTVGASSFAGTPCRDFQVWLNVQDGRIRFLYNRVFSQDAGASRIGLRQTYFGITLEPDEVIVSNNDVAGASNGKGYTFTPAPPQPTRTHTVTVDALMQSVGFLQTGFSGNFEQMIIKDPSGTAIPCVNNGDVICLIVDNVVGDRMVQYVQVDVNGRTGVWSATIDGGTSGSSTYSFTGMAASEIEAQGTYDRQRASFKAGSAVDATGRGDDGKHAHRLDDEGQRRPLGQRVHAL